MIGCYRTLLVCFLTLAVTGHLSANAQSSHTTLIPTSLGEEQKNKAIAAFESSLLKLFGLSRRPRPSKDIVIPQYMIDLYRSKTNDHLTYIPSTLKHRTRGGADPANTIRSFYHQDGEFNHGCQDYQCARIWFNISYIPNDEMLTSAELRVFVERNSSDDVPLKHLKHRIEVYEIMKPVLKDVEPIARLIDVQNVIVQNSSWMSLDVHPAVMKWKSKPRLNHGLEVRVFPYNQHTSNTPLKHVRLRRSAGAEDAAWNSERPLLVTYTNDAKSRSKRSSKRNSRRSRRRKKGKKKNKQGKRRKGHKNQCKRHPLFVDFSDVGWNDWIVAPAGYRAYFCDGLCEFPFADHLNTTNHAIVQTLVNQVDSRAAPTACCVPTTLSTISLLYMDEYDKVVLKDYDDMVVEGCGCR